MRHSNHSRFFAIGLWLLGQSAPAGADSVEEMFAAARAHKQNNQLDEAASSFKTIGIEHPEHTLAERAMQEYFDIVAPKLAGPDRGSLEEARDVAAKFVDGLCNRSTNKTGCEHFQTIHCSILRLDAERHIQNHDTTRDEDRVFLKEAGDIYLGIWKRYGGRSNSPSGCRMDEILYNAAHAYRAGGDSNAAVTMYETLVDPRNGFSGTPLANRALYQLAKWFTLVTDFPEAITKFEQLATIAPKDERASDARYNAMVLRLQTGSIPEAMKHAETLLGLYGPTKKNEATHLILEVGQALVAQGVYAQAKSWLQKTITRVKQDGTFEEKLVAAGLLGRTLDALGDKKSAAEQYRGIFASATSGGWLRSEPTEHDGPMWVSSAWVWQAVDIVADSAIFLIRADGTNGPPIVVSKSTKAMQDAVNGRTEAIERALNRYGKPLEDMRKPPAKWKTAVAGVTAGVFMDMAEEIDRGLETMKRGKAMPDEVRAAKEIAEPARNRAKVAASQCLKMAIEQQQWSDETNRCQRWLETHYPKEYRMVEELAPGYRAPMESAILSGGARLFTQ